MGFNEWNSDLITAKKTAHLLPHVPARSVWALEMWRSGSIERKWYVGDTCIAQSTEDCDTFMQSAKPRTRGGT